MNIEINYKHKKLIVKISGKLIGNRVNELERKIIPIILILKSKKVIINLFNIELIDKNGIESIIKISSIINRFNGRLILCSMNDYVKRCFDNSDIYDYCFKSNNERTSELLFNI